MTREEQNAIGGVTFAVSENGPTVSPGSTPLVVTRPPFTPEQEARIREIVREALGWRVITPADLPPESNKDTAE